ncbi:MAG: polyphosphate kinase 1 [Lachnospiraceae bacterium]
MKENAIYVNRELSWLKFNERVLEEAADPEVPLCERLSFISIFQSNLEEFYMVRVGTLQDQTLLQEVVEDNKTKMTSQEQIDAIVAETRRLCQKRDQIYAEIMQKIAEEYGMREVKFADLNSQQANFVEQYFEVEIAPLLSPMIVGKKQSFPFMSNKSVYAVVVMETSHGKEKIGIIPCTNHGIERLVTIPNGEKKEYMRVEEIILHFVPKIFDGYNIKSKSLVRITRNADIDVSIINDEDLNYRDAMSEVIRRRKKLAPVRMEMTRTLDEECIEVLCTQLGLERSRVFQCDTPLEMSFVSRVRDCLRDHTELFYKRRVPKWPEELERNKRLIPQIEKKDVLLSYPYHTIRPFIEMLREAAYDDSVVSIKMTLYRLAKNSKIVEALEEAAENGKEVVVLVELKARFDEENNIEWSRRLEHAGCQVIYGIDGVKVHSKLCLITKKNGKNLEYITQIGTGNYNEKTAELYTDLSLITADHTIGTELASLFQQIGVGQLAAPQKHLLVAPKGLQNRLIEMIDEQIGLAKDGKKSYIGIKINSLTDIRLIKKLVEASKAGVKIDMIVRGICCLVPGVKGETENIRVVSIVGRYLEHSRIYIFGPEKEKIYIGSADWMTRNTLKRIEVAVPIQDKDIKKKLRKMFQIMLDDNTKARKMQSDGTYKRVKKGKEPLNSQEFFGKNIDKLTKK